jgi:hypothetical protein
MFINYNIVAIIFKLINFIALLSITFLIFKKYIMPNIVAGIIRKKEHQASLSAQQANLEKQQISLDTFLKEDILLCAEFRSKIDKWKKTVTLETESYKKEHSKILINSTKRTETIATQREHNHVKKIVTHAVINNIKTSLSTHFKNEKQSSEYLNSIFNFMDKKIQ